MFRNLDLKPVYNSQLDNIAEDFYNPVMKKAISFDRISGFFSSKALALYSEGLEHFLKEECRYRLIVSKEISEC